MDERPAPTGHIVLPPPGGRVGRLVLAVGLLLVGLLQVSVGIQADRTGTTVGGAVILVVAVSLARRRDRGVSIGSGGVSIPGWPRGADVPWSQVGRFIVQRLPLGVTRLRVVRDDQPDGAPPRTLATLTGRQAADVVPRVVALASEHRTPVVHRDGGPYEGSWEADSG